MTEQGPCPDSGRWRQLLDGTLADEEQSALAHLEACPGCQQTLDGLAADSAAWSRAARHLARARPDGTALRRLLAGLEVEADEAATRPEPDAGTGLALDFLDPPREPGELGRLGHYAVRAVLGRGGMGVVLQAFDEALHRVVAIKVMAPQLATSAGARQRFVREARAAAAVRNEHVIDIHAVEEANGLPYLVMEYVAGVSLQERLDRAGPLELKEVLRIGAQVAAGLAAAHAQGLIHRDVKPANILLENGVERVKITDFGLARAVDDASLTQSGVVAGTPAYMAPEQARGEAVDHRADLFSLGSVLYALCTGRSPFRASGTMAVLKRVCDDTPRPIQEINPEVRGWLVEIIARLHAKDPAERFPSAAAVGELLGKHLARLQQPGLETAPVPAARASRPAGRQRPTRRRWAVAAGVLLVLLGGSLGLTEATGVSRVAATVVRIFTPEGTLVVQVDDPGVKVTVEGDGGLVITGAGPQEVRLRPGRYRFQATKDGRPLQEEVVTISRGGRQVVTVAVEAPPAFRFEPPPPGPLDGLDPAQLPAEERFPWQPPELVAVLGQHRGRSWEPAPCVAVSPDGKRAASCGGRIVYVWDADTLRLRTLLVGHTGPNWAVAFSPDGHRLLSGGEDQTVRLWDLDTGRELRRFGHPGGVGAVAYSPDGRRALSGGWDHTMRLWDVESGKELHCFNGHADAVNSVAFSPDGMHVLSGSTDKTLRLWNLETGRQVRLWEAHTLPFRAVLLPDGRRALSGSADGAVRLWDVQTGQEVRHFRGHPDRVFTVAVSADGRRALSGGVDQTVYLWDVETGRELRRMPCRGAVGAVAFSPDGRRALAGIGNGTLGLWDLESGQELHPVAGFKEGPGLLRVAFSPDGRRVLASARDDFMRLWDVTGGRELRRFELPQTIWGVAFPGDGRHVLGAGGGGLVGWDAESGREVRRFVGARGSWDVAVSGDGRRAVTGSTDGTVRLWDVERGRELNCFPGPAGSVQSVALTPDGRAAVSGGAGGAVRLWDLEEGRERHVLQAGGATVWSVAFSPDGRHVATGDDEGFVRLWDVTGTAPRMRPLLKWHPGGVRAVAFAPDARTLASAGWDGWIILWEVPTGTKRREWQLPGDVEGAAFAPDGRHLAVANGNGTVYLLRLAKP